MIRNTHTTVDGKVYGFKGIGQDKWKFWAGGKPFIVWKQGSGYLKYAYRRESDPDGVRLEECRSLREIVQCALVTAHV
jgi:hypothetical protein